jgi:hypothetical protein
MNQCYLPPGEQGIPLALPTNGKEYLVYFSDVFVIRVIFSMFVWLVAGG